MNNNHCLIAAAGAGKTTYIVEQAIDTVQKNRTQKF